MKVIGGMETRETNAYMTPGGIVQTRKGDYVLVIVRSSWEAAWDAAAEAMTQMKKPDDGG